jgi:O-methyltransferase
VLPVLPRGRTCTPAISLTLMLGKMSFMKAAVKKMLGSLLSFRYFEDGMGTTHLADFLEDSRFQKAYRLGVGTGSWHGCELRWRAYNACWAAKQTLRLDGDFVECGVNRGGLSRVVIDYVDFASSNRRFFLLDTYKGHPDVASPNRNDYQECYEDVLRTFAPFSNVRVIRGSVPETLSLVDSDQICYLSIDMNHPTPEVAALRFFWPKLVLGAIVLLDDYSFSEHYRPSKTAMVSLGQELDFCILTMPTGQGLIIKT